MNLDLRNSHTQPYKCEIEGTPCKGRVSVNKDKNVFLCQNKKCGVPASNKLTYKYSWLVQYSDEDCAFIDTNITDFEFITEEELNAGSPPSFESGTTPLPLDGKEIEMKIDGVSYIAVLKLKS